MARGPFDKLVLCIVLFVSSPVRGDETARAPITRDRVIQLARARAPQVLVAQTRIHEARGGLVTAGLLARENPVVEAFAGPRWADERTTDAEVELWVPIELGGRRAKRTEAARAELQAAEHLTTDEQRRAIGAALVEYYQVLYADSVVALASKRKSLAEELLAVGEARLKAGGDVTKLDLNLARNELALAESEVLVASSAVTRARAGLAAVLGIRVEDVANVVGDLADRRLFASPGAPTTRSDVGARRAEVAAAAAQVRVADAERWPSLAFHVKYAHEDEGADILLGGIALSLPMFNRGQGERIAARARQERARVELAALENTIATQGDAARASFAAAVSAVELLEKRALPLATENEQMAQESYRAGKLDLPALLIIRRDALATRATHLDRLRDAALAGVELAVTLQTIR
jgi:cobalt-zinc-cadmium efflux system outer membrane protein